LLLGKKIVEIKAPRPRRLYIKVDAKNYKDTVKKLVEKKDIKHISTMTGLDTGKDFEILTHLFGQGVEVTVVTTSPRENAQIDSITSILPGAVFYEREIYDLVGVKFKGHPNLQRLVLPEDWPEDVHPLRKDFKPKRATP
jgi:NADH:ubiquinone oxidoreductase subunit C